MESANNNKNTGLKIALGILLALFIGTGFYTSKLYNDKKQNEAELTKEKQLVMNDLSNMAKKYDIAIDENEVAYEDLDEARNRIEGSMDYLKRSKHSQNSLMSFRKKYISIQEEMNIRLAENDKLKIEN